MTAQPIELPHPEAPVSTASAVDHSALTPPVLANLADGRPGWIEGVQFTSRGCQPWQIIPDCYVPEASTDVLSVADFVAQDNVVIEPSAVSVIDGCESQQLNDTMRARVDERVRAAVMAKLPCALAQQIETQLVANVVGAVGISSTPQMAFARLLARANAEEIRVWAANAAAVPTLLAARLITPITGGRAYVGPLGLPFLPLTCVGDSSPDDVPNGEVTLWAAPGIWADWLGYPNAAEIDFLRDRSGRIEAPFADSVGGAHVTGGNIMGNQYVVTGRLRHIVVVPDCNIYGQTLCLAETPECS